MSIDSLRRSARATVSGFPQGFWWLWLSTLVNRTGAFVLTFLSLYLTQELGHSAWFAGLVVALHGLGGVAGSPLGGLLTDRWGRRPTMVTMHLAAAACSAALAVVTSAWAIATAVLLMGVAMQAVRPSINATIADMVPAHDVRRAYALNYWALNLGFAIASIAGGAAAFLGYRTLFVVDAVATVLCAVIVFLRLPETRPQAAVDKRGEPVAEEKVSMLTVLRDAPFRTLVLLNLLVCLVFTAPWIGLPLTMAGEGLPPSSYGMVIAVNGIVIVGFQLLVNKLTDKRSPVLLLTLSALLFAFGTGATALAGSSVAFAATVIVWTVGEMIHVPTNAAATARLAPEHARGRYQGVMGMSWAVAGFVAPVAAGAIVGGPGPDVLWTATAAIGVLAAVGYYTRLRKALADEDTRDTPDTPDASNTPETPATPDTRAGAAEQASVSA
ncbi:major facilitator superfamily permease [Streptomyces venezuelae]|uniref:MDR family MFS transporter n=1 Tax=Streptomyces gardneri TaxID=66892 RepID=UPI0006BDFFA7|nr:MFS transporter [Streptomyces gardneri]ALO09966.1 major facilitator superfamily permease [Streptomyces venezuelae]QPK47006.1 MFS transporter [Streptomyces gardneri]WRK38422.1 MFS transporter [Streptomyces venezuelae]CUM39590.1 putative integral membrane transport protein [Streptomyces venezuelae]